MEQIVFRPIYPLAVDGSWFMSGNLPILLEATEVVQPDVIALTQRPLHAADPPVVTARLDHVPLVEGISPALSCPAEGVWRNTGDDRRLQVRIQRKNVRVRPHIGAIEVYEDGHVA